MLTAEAGMEGLRVERCVLPPCNAVRPGLLLWPVLIMLKLFCKLRVFGQDLGLRGDRDGAGTN